MSLSQENKNGAAIVCREVFDEASHPSNEEVLDYARRLGIDSENEPHLLDLAREGLMAALPKGWKPCYAPTQGGWYYYHAATNTTTWEHPLDAKYTELVEQARAGRSRQASLDDDSKTTAKDLESHEEMTLPKETLSKMPVPQTKIPTKLAPLKKLCLDTSRNRRESSKKTNDSKIMNITCLMTDRNSRDYTNLRFQDPKFFESPNVVMKNMTECDINLHDIVKRSESMSPRYEKDWEQLSNKFNNDDNNFIDIDKLSVSSLTKSESKSQIDKIDDDNNDNDDDDKNLNQFICQKELVLSGGGSMFLKSNRSRDNTPINDDDDDNGKLEEFDNLQMACGTNNDFSIGTDRPKSILREKYCEDDDRPTDEERKSVRFDLDKEQDDIKFLYSGSEDNDWDSDSMDKEAAERDKKNQFLITLKECLDSNDLKCKTRDSAINSDIAFQEIEKIDGFCKNSDLHDNDSDEISLSNSANNSKIIGRRFYVKNVSESEHMSQFNRDDSTELISVNKFSNIKNIDLPAKISGNSLRTAGKDLKSKNLDEIRKNKEILMDAIKVTDDSTKIDAEDITDKIHEKLQRNSDIDDIFYEINREHDDEIVNLRRSHEVKLEAARIEFDEHFRVKCASMERELEDKLSELRRKLAEKEKDEMDKLAAEMDESRGENLKKMRHELEFCYEKERQDILEKLKIELNERKKELLELRNHEIQVLENEFTVIDDDKAIKLAEHELTQRHNEQIEILKNELDKEFSDLKNTLRTQQREKVTKITEDHEKCLAEILRDFRVDERLARKVYKQRLEEIRSDLSRGIDKETKKLSEHATRQETIEYEKIRCEKRLLEDKYKTLKEKYLKLKNEVRVAVERRSKRKESNATASETERSASTRTRTDRTESMDQKIQSKNVSSITRSIDGNNQVTSDDTDGKRQLIQQQQQQTPGFRRIADIRDGKFESDDTTTASETMNSDLLKKRKIFAKKIPSNIKILHHSSNNMNNNNNSSMENPVENIRKQLEKLEDLGDQLPSNETAYTLRYPFQDKAPMNASSELEFFRHRIHVERDSVKRAREALRVQRSIFQGRQRALKQRSARATLEQLVQEERELSEMEVSLHRTRSLLGEKVIHLRHLEQSLERVVSARKSENQTAPIKSDELTLSDMSSASSGFSSTDLGTDTFIDKPDHYQESTEIIANLENLNSEIREIWGVLNKRQGNNIPPPPTLSYSDLGWFPYQHVTTQANNVQSFGTPNIQSNILSQLTAKLPSTANTQNIIAQYGPNSGFTTSVGTVERGPSSNLIERTRNMRDWLRQARMESTDLVSPGQATL